MRLGDVDGYERRLREALIALNKRRITGVTLVEAVDEAALWTDDFEDQQPILLGLDLDSLFSRAPLLLCSIAAEIGFRFEGVGTEYWNKLETALGVAFTMAQRGSLGDAFDAVAERYSLSRPSESAFSAHFSIISWPIANALLPLDLIGPVTRMLANAPAVALPRPGRGANFASLRAWASTAEGARLVDWLRFEPASERVLNALLTDNRGGGLSTASFARLSTAIAGSSEAFFATREARQRIRRSKSTGRPHQIDGRLTLVQDDAGTRLFVTWPSLPSELAEEARIAARAAGWRPQLWAAGARLHSDTALGDGPFALTHAQIPNTDQSAYVGAAAVFGEGSPIAVALAARVVDWNEALLFDVNDERLRGEQRVSPFDARSGLAWIASRTSASALEGLRLIGTVVGYRVFEADLASEGDRALLYREGLLAARDRVLAARHPIDAITAPPSVVRPGRGFTLFRPGPPITLEEGQPMRSGERLSNVGAGLPRLRCDVAPNPDTVPVSVVLLERDSAFSALMEQRLQVRVESAHALRNVPISVELEIDGKLIVRRSLGLGELPVTLDQQSMVLKPLYENEVRRRLLESGAGTLRFSIGRLAKVEAELSRPTGAVDWTASRPSLIDGGGVAEMACAPATAPHRFVPTDVLHPPQRGAAGYVLRFADGRIADPMKLVAASNFNLGDFAASFGNDVGSRQIRDGGRGSGELARARVAWARAQCDTLQAIAAKSRVVQQFEEPLVQNLCGREWCDRERDDRTVRSDPHEALYLVALEHGLATLPERAPGRYSVDFAEAFAVHARRLDPDWPLGREIPLDGAMDDALNLGFGDAVRSLQARGAIVGIDPEDCDFGSPEEAWAEAAAEALRRIRRSRLARLIAPDAGGRQLRDRYYAHVGIVEMAEDLAAWSRAFALPRGQLSAEAAAGALQLWLSPASCEALDGAMRVLVNDPFVARATRYAAIRMTTTLGGSVS